jgi:hypothetical protein
MSRADDERLIKMRELMKSIDAQIMLCDDTGDLFSLASTMIVSAKIIFINQIGEEGTRLIFERVMKDI